MSGASAPNETIECPLCLGVGNLKRTEILDRLGVKDFARVATLSAEEAFRLLSKQHTNDHQSGWARFETELTKRTVEIEQCHRGELQTLGGEIRELESAARVAEELHALDVQLGRANAEEKLLTTQSQNADLSRRVEDCLREVAELRKRNQELESDMSKIARIGKLEEVSFADEARSWAGICVSEKLPKNGDFVLAYRDPSGAPLEPRMLVDCKDKSAITEADLSKLVRDSKERSIPVAILVARDESQLRQVDKDQRWDRTDGVWMLRTCRSWLPRDLDVLKPIFERMRVEGFDVLEKNAGLAVEVRRTFADIDRIESELKKATKALGSAAGLVSKYRGRLQELCDAAAARKMPPMPDRSVAEISQ
jgi:hypothetical protein